MVLDHGRIIERGSHEKLIAEKGVYYQLYTGAFVGCKTGVLLTLGTGLGGGIILNGKVLMGTHAAAGEVSCLVSNMAAKKLNCYRSLG